MLSLFLETPPKVRVPLFLVIGIIGIINPHINGDGCGVLIPDEGKSHMKLPAIVSSPMS